MILKVTPQLLPLLCPYCDEINHHRASSIKINLLGTNTVAIKNTVTINHAGLLRKKTMVQ
jgi:hypothetical protein